jgi:hypothetical protein
MEPNFVVGIKFAVKIKMIPTIIQYLIMSNSIQNLEKKRNTALSIKDCLKLIGVQEITANIYAVPKNTKSQKQYLAT